MQKAKAIGKEIVIVAVMLALALILSILAHGFGVRHFSDPLDLQGVEYLDSFTLADSMVILQRSLEGETILLEYQKNWLLPWYALMSLYPVEDGFTTAIVTPLAAYPVTVEGEALSVGLQKTGLRWPEFSQTYGLGMLLFLNAQYILYRKLKKK